METTLRALSIKQPWAALIVAGIKTIEVRSWPTRRRGTILIHAGKIPDSRSSAWMHVNTRQLAESAELRGGIVGVAELVDCVKYATQEEFDRDAPKHLNEPDWFNRPELFGFQLASVRPVSFYNIPGNTSFFRVDGIRTLIETSEATGKSQLDGHR